jgi:hypothetical protein
MCRPRHFAVTYSINPWMDPAAWQESGDALHAHPSCPLYLQKRTLIDNLGMSAKAKSGLMSFAL